MRGIDAHWDLTSLLGLEGVTARYYFQGFTEMVRREFQFTGRRRRLAPDPINALPSLGYTLVYGEIASLLDGMGFDPYLGFYHQPRYGHATLASDLLKGFRTPLVERFTLYLINNRIFKTEDFFLHQPQEECISKSAPINTILWSMNGFCPARCRQGAARPALDSHFTDRRSCSARP